MNKYTQIKEIMDCFDFETVHKFMTQPLMPDYDDEGKIIGRHVWKMCLPGGSFNVPTIDRLKDLAFDLLVDVSKNKPDQYTYIATGPFKASNNWGNLALEFIVTDWYYEA